MRIAGLPEHMRKHVGGMLCDGDDIVMCTMCSINRARERGNKDNYEKL